MTGYIPSSSKGKTGKKTVIKYVEYDVYELPYLYFSKATAIIFDNIDNGNDGVLPLSIFFDLIEILGEGFNSEELAGQLKKVEPN